ncbi:predicted amino acid aldolase or racemase [Longilinea arvoryzae]|uniref:Predicted amino acid aldolase or racemase n=1 Tax=Longilinea arvoryzae TaxID=360412 RepID=A0A0S7BI63_9CHLR|nr:alanine racemase [Longilinea arvoryzae]GAP15437.1 predicted amino acid aldolase or racemase [Longilinea arvoryzae]
MSIFESIDRPTLLLNEKQARQNIAFMAEKAAQNGVRFRPHFKTHQSAEIGEWFRPYGVSEITVSSVDMAEYFADHGWNDITIAFPVNLRQVQAIDALARRIRVGLLVESTESAAYLARHLTAQADVWIKIDVGAGRTGLPWQQPEKILPILQVCQSSHPLHLRGLLTHAGHTYGAGSVERVRQIYAETLQRLESVHAYLSQASRSPLELSVGDTPACTLVEDLRGVDEIRPGNFVFYDAEQTLWGTCRPDQMATAVACPVVAVHAEREAVVVYGGAIHLNKDFTTYQGQRAYGLVALPEANGWSEPLEGAYVSSLSQEHGLVHVPERWLDRIQIGGLLMILPAHSCLPVTALKSFLTLEGRRIDTLNS